MNVSFRTLRCAWATAALLWAVAAGAQEVRRSDSDFMGCVACGGRVRLCDGLHALWSKELWLKDAWTRIDRLYWSAGLGYDVRPWLSVGADYTFIAVRRNGGWEYRNRGNADVTFRYAPAGRWRLSLRERVRVTSANRPADPRAEANPAWSLRSRLTVEYRPARAAWSPYASCEVAGTLNAPPDAGQYVERIRTTLGVKWALSARSRLDLFCRYDRDTSKEPDYAGDVLRCVVVERENRYILGVSYELTLGR